METLSDMFQEDVIGAEISHWAFCGFPSSACAAEHPCRDRVGWTPPDMPALFLRAGTECTNPALPFAFKGQKRLFASE